MGLYKHLDLEERAKIVFLQDQGFTAGEIADELNRDASTIYRELARNRNPETGDYTAKTADNTYKRRLQAPQGRIRNPLIKKYVIENLTNLITPEKISGRMRIELLGKSVSPETIYLFIYKEARAYRCCLPRHHMKRRLKGQRKTHTKSHIPNKISIDDRPKEIDERKQVGHFESDICLLESGATS